MAARTFVYPPTQTINPSIGINGDPAPLSSTQIAYQDATGDLTAVTPSTPLPVEVTISSVTTSENLTKIAGSPIDVGTGAAGVGTQRIAVASDSSIQVSNFPATQPISAASLPLPTGAATEAKQDTGNTSLSSIDSKIPASLTVSATRLLVDGSGVTQPVSGSVSVSNFPATQPISGSVSVSNFPATQPISAASLPLPTGAATETTVSSIDTKIPSNLTVSSTRLLVDGSGVTQPVSAASLPLPTGAATAAKQPALGTAGSASADVITVQGIASMTALKVDGSAVTQPVSAASLPLPTGAATEAKQDTGNTSLSNIDSKIPASLTVSSTRLLVDGSGVTQPVSGSVSVSNFPATQVIKGIGGSDAVLTQELTGLVPKVYDDIVLTYVGASDRTATVTYKNVGVTVATLTLTYDGSDRLIEVTRT